MIKTATGLILWYMRAIYLRIGLALLAFWSTVIYLLT